MADLKPLDFVLQTSDIFMIVFKYQSHYQKPDFVYISVATKKKSVCLGFMKNITMLKRKSFFLIYTFTLQMELVNETSADGKKQQPSATQFQRLILSYLV